MAAIGSESKSCDMPENNNMPLFFKAIRTKWIKNPIPARMRIKFSIPFRNWGAKTVL
jgi:hypothetical protein